MEKSNVLLKDFIENKLAMSTFERNKFSAFYLFTLEEYINKSLSSKMHKKLQEECVKFIEGRTTPNNVSDKSQIVACNENNNITIFDVPFIPELLDILFPSIANKLNCVKKQSFQRMIELLDVDYNTFSSWDNAGPAKWNSFMEIKKLLSTDEGKDKVIDAYNSCYISHRFPEFIDEEEDSLKEKIDIAVRQYLSYLEKVAHYKANLLKDAKRMKLMFLEHNSNEELAKEFGLRSTERVRQLKIQYIENIINGTLVDANNLSFSDSLKKEIEYFLKQLPAICSKKYLEEVLQCENYEDTITSLVLPLQSVPQNENSLSNSPYKSFDQVYYTSTKESLSWVRIYMESLCGVLGHDSNIFDVRPLDIDDIMGLLEQIEPDFEFDREVVYDILQQHDWIERLAVGDDVKYQLKYQYLKKAYNYLARIVYEKKQLNLDDIDIIHREKINDFNASSIKLSVPNARDKISWVTYTKSNRVLKYDESGEPQKTMRDFIKEWVAERDVFTLDDILQTLSDNGYKTIIENTVRAYIMNYCCVDNNNRNVFCRSECIHNYTSEYSWRDKSQSGITHWLIIKVREHLLVAPSETLPVADLEEKLNQDLQSSTEKFNIKKSIEMYLCRYSQPDDGLFKFSKNKKEITLTARGRNLSDEELMKVGRRVRNSKPEYYDVVISKIIALLKDSNNGEMRLLDLRNACLDELDNRAYTAFYKIVDNYLPVQVVKYKKADKPYLYLKLQEEKIEYVESMTVQSACNVNSQIDEPVLVKEEIQRPIREFGQMVSVDWNILREDFCSQLNFYIEKWNAEISFEEGVDKYIRFIQQLDYTKNMRLTRQLPQSFMLFWHYQNDTFAYMDYLTNIVICYERLLREIHLANTGIALDSKGLMDTVKMMESMNHWITANDTNLFYRLFRNIRTERNKISHGEEFVSKTLTGMVIAITQYIALYIYTVARFWEEK